MNITRCKSTLLLELLGTNFPLEDVNITVDIINRRGIAVISGEKFDIVCLYDACLFDEDLQIPESLSNEFPCLNYLKTSSSFNGIGELQALNLSWDFKNSIVWSLLCKLEFNLKAVRSAIFCIRFIGCTIAEYLENYKTTFEAEQEYKEPEIIAQFVNSKLLRNSNSKYYALLVLICCLPPELSMPYQFQYIFDGFFDQFRFRYRYFSVLENLRFVKKKNVAYFMSSDLQVALRKNVLSLEDKTKAVKHFHRAYVTARDLKFYDEMAKYWRYNMDQEDLREIALNCNLSFPGL